METLVYAFLFCGFVCMVSQIILDNTKFIRVSNCAIIARLHVKRIKPSISMKFILTMSDGSLVDVTRSYYSSFKDFFGI